MWSPSKKQPYRYIEVQVAPGCVLTTEEHKKSSVDWIKEDLLAQNPVSYNDQQNAFGKPQEQGKKETSFPPASGIQRHTTYGQEHHD